MYMQILVDDETTASLLTSFNVKFKVVSSRSRDVTLCV